MTPDWIGRLRLASGLVLVTYLVTHLLNHALGLLGLEALEAGRRWFLLLWRHPLGTLALYAALVVHPAIGLRSLLRRRHLRMPAWEAWQLVLGLTVPALLAAHVAGTRLAQAWYGVEDRYARVLLTLWELRPWLGVRQALLVLVVWTHAAIGLHFWLRLRPWYPRAAPVLLAAAVLLPALALLGFVEGGREVSRRAREPGWVAATLAATGPRLPGAVRGLGVAQDAILATYAAALAGVLGTRLLRAWRAGRRGRFRVEYVGGQAVVAPLGATLLEASRLGGVPHAAVCGGRGRCSTCRVRVMRGLEALPSPGPLEQRVLDRVGAAPGVRLACQLRPAADLLVAPRVRAAGPGGARTGSAHDAGGREQEVVVLFADLRGFTTIAERKLPYDVVFLLNRYFEVVGEAIRRAGGIPNQFTGDGVMALFGVGSAAADAARQALRAAVDMVEGVEALSRTLAPELPAPLRLGIGLHCGPAVVGRMGYAETQYLTAVGDTVHVASRLESLTKDYDCELVVSEALALRAGLDAGRWPRHEVTVRNRAEPLAIRVIASVRALGAGGGRPTPG